VPSSAGGEGGGGDTREPACCPVEIANSLSLGVLPTVAASTAPESSGCTCGDGGNSDDPVAAGPANSTPLALSASARRLPRPAKPSACCLPSERTFSSGGEQAGGSTPRSGLAGAVAGGPSGVPVVAAASLGSPPTAAAAAGEVGESGPAGSEGGGVTKVSRGCREATCGVLVDVVKTVVTVVETLPLPVELVVSPLPGVAGAPDLGEETAAGRAAVATVMAAASGGDTIEQLAGVGGERAAYEGPGPVVGIRTQWAGGVERTSSWGRAVCTSSAGVRAPAGGGDGSSTIPGGGDGTVVVTVAAIAVAEGLLLLL